VDFKGLNNYCSPTIRKQYDNYYKVGFILCYNCSSQNYKASEFIKINCVNVILFYVDDLYTSVLFVILRCFNFKTKKKVMMFIVMQ